MNQILHTYSKPKKKEPLKLKAVFAIFSVCIILFGAVLIGKSIFSSAEKNQEEIATNQPLVEIERKGRNIYVSIKHDKPIDNITYRWGKNEEVALPGEGKTELQEKIAIPVGKNKITLKVTDNGGKTTTYNQEYTVDEDEKIKPQIDISIENTKIKIVAKDETEIDHILYYWNQEEPTKIEAQEELAEEIEESIEILRGDNTLTIVAVDAAGNESKKEQVFRGVNKPKIEVSREGNELNIKVTDETGIKKIEYTLNDAFYTTDTENTGVSLGMKEVNFKQSLYPGANKIVIKAYSESGIEAEFSGEATI